MKSRLAIPFGGVTDRKRKQKMHPGYEASRQMIDRMFLGRLAFGPSPFRVLGRKIDRAFLGRLAFRPSPFEALGLGRLAKETEPESMIPTKKNKILIDPNKLFLY